MYPTRKQTQENQEECIAREKKEVMSRHLEYIFYILLSQLLLL